MVTTKIIKYDKDKHYPFLFCKWRKTTSAEKKRISEIIAGIKKDRQNDN